MAPQSDPSVDDTGCTILHVDMDAFYASVELKRRPELRGKPVIVGAVGNRGVVLSATYEAREFGVSGGIPIARARKLCPQATYLAPDFSAYRDVSQGVMAVFRDVTPHVSPISLDEAFLDVAGALRRLGKPRQVAAYIKARIHDEQGIPCSVGVAPTMFLAKLASTRSKPDGLLVVPRDGVLDFLHPLPVGALWGVGEKTELALTKIGLRTVRDIAQTPVEALCAAIGDASGKHLHALAWGRDERIVRSGEPEKSIGSEETFMSDVTDEQTVLRELLRLSDRTARRVRSSGMLAKTVAIKVRYPDFTTVSRSRKLTEPTDVGEVIYETALQLFRALKVNGAPLRLVGVRAEGLIAGGVLAEQLSLDPRPAARSAAERAMDAAAERFGSKAVRPGTLIERPGAGADPLDRPGWEATPER